MIAKKLPAKIHLWCPGLFESKGGIQVFSSYLLAGLEALNHQAQYDVFLKHDAHLPLDPAASPQTRFHFTGKIPHPARTIAFATKLISQGIWQQPDLTISTHLNFTVAAYYLKKLTNIPYWTIAHGVDAWNIDNPQLQRSLQNADLILAVSGYTRDRLLTEQNLDPDRVVILPNTFDSDRFQIAPKSAHLLQKYNLTPTQPVILTVARLAEVERYKGYDRVLAALPSIRQAIPDVRYIIIGQGDDRSRIESLIQQFKLQDCVTLAGFIPDAELCDYYNLCDVFAMPSKREGFGIVYLEALACGKPTLGGNQDGAVDALCQGELGALVNPDDVDEITQTLIQILQGNYPNQLMYQPKALRQKVIDTYGFEKFKQTLSSLFEEWQQHKQKPPA